MLSRVSNSFILNNTITQHLSNNSSDSITTREIEQGESYNWRMRQQSSHVCFERFYFQQDSKAYGRHSWLKGKQAPVRAIKAFSKPRWVSSSASFVDPV